MKALPYLLVALVLVAGVVAFVVLRKPEERRPKVTVGEGGVVSPKPNPSATSSPLGWM